MLLRSGSPPALQRGGDWGRASTAGGKPRFAPSLKEDEIRQVVAGQPALLQAPGKNME